MMKFDCIIMNPPYSKNLHLKILAEAIKHLKDDNSKCVNLSPMRWLQDPLVEYKKHTDFKTFEYTISRHLDSVTVIPTVKCQQLFNALINIDLGIYVAKKNFSIYDYSNEWKNTTNAKHFEMIKKYWHFPEISKFNESRNNTEYFIAIRLITNPARATFYNICSNIGPIFKSKTESGIFYKDAMYKSKTFSDDRQLNGIWFKTKTEAVNFYNSTLTVAYKYFCSLVMRDIHISPKFLLFMSDYTKPWDDARFYKFFNITPEEQKVIEDTMEKYR